MKNAIKSVMFLALLTIGFLAQAQSCSVYYPMEKGVSYELTHYDKKGKAESVTHNTVKDVSGSKAIVHTVVTDDDGKETVNAEYEMVCDGNKVSIDINKVIGETLKSSLAQSGSDVKASVDGTDLVVPNDLKVGTTLPDTSINMDIEAGTMKLNFSVKTTNKKVIAEETITVPAGTFDCVVISQHTETKMMITKKGDSKVWLAKGVGVVKQEDVDKKGKVTGSQVLTKFSK